VESDGDCVGECRSSGRRSGSCALARSVVTKSGGQVSRFALRLRSGLPAGLPPQ
jgi:hypothetical protein